MRFAELRALVAAAALASAAPSAAAAAGWSFQVGLGGAWNLPTPLAIRQSGRPRLRLTGRYDTRPFEPPIYYVLRVGRWAGDAEWALELVHHKVYLSNRPAEVERFSVSHGYNLVLLSRTLPLARRVRTRVAAGAVIAHPESTVRGERLRESGGPLGGGYHLSGAAAVFGLERPLRHASGLFAVPEARLGAAWARVPVADGSADVPNVALHGTAAVGFETGR